MTVVGNVGDDVEVLGLHVSPDLDSILYALAGLNDEARGWGRAGETWSALDTVATLDGETWFRLGDLDLGLHLVRTQALRAGEPLSRSRRGSPPRSASRRRSCPRPTTGCARGSTPPAGEFPFQEWFVARGHRDEVDGAALRGRRVARPGAGRARGDRRGRPAPARAEQPVRLDRADPRRAARSATRSRARRVPCVAVSPLIGGRAVKGPADRMLARLAGGTSPRHVAGCYAGLIDALVVDEADADDLDGLGDVRPIVTRTLMADADARRRLAEAALGAVPA